MAPAGVEAKMFGTPNSSRRIVTFSALNSRAGNSKTVRIFIGTTSIGCKYPEYNAGPRDLVLPPQHSGERRQNARKESSLATRVTTVERLAASGVIMRTCL